VLHQSYTRSMAEIAARELRNHTADVLRRAAGGENITITVRGKPVAELVPISSDGRRRPLSRSEMIDLLSTSQADPALRDELKILAGDTTDDLGPIW
jgi:prevent-host-death family protein